MTFFEVLRSSGLLLAGTRWIKKWKEEERRRDAAKARHEPFVVHVSASVTTETIKNHNSDTSRCSSLLTLQSRASPPIPPYHPRYLVPVSDH